jgi:hypothetical protein
MLEVLFAAVQRLRFIKVLDWLPVHYYYQTFCFWGMFGHGAGGSGLCQNQGYDGESEDGKMPGPVSCLYL